MDTKVLFEKCFSPSDVYLLTAVLPSPRTRRYIGKKIYLHFDRHGNSVNVSNANYVVSGTDFPCERRRTTLGIRNMGSSQFRIVSNTSEYNILKILTLVGTRIIIWSSTRINYIIV